MRGLGELLFKTTSNEDMDVAATLTKSLLKSAQDNIRLVSGTLPYDFYEEKGIGKTIKEITKNGAGIDVQIISGPKYDKKSKTILELANSGKIKLFISKNYPKKHFLIIDNKDVRAEVSHTSSNLNISKTRGSIVRDSIFLAKKLAIEFDKIKKNSKPYKESKKKGIKK